MEYFAKEIHFLKMRVLIAATILIASVLAEIHITHVEVEVPNDKHYLNTLDISYEVSAASFVQFGVQFSAHGQITYPQTVSGEINSNLAAGNHTFRWTNAIDTPGKSYYFLVLKAMSASDEGLTAVVISNITWLERDIYYNFFCGARAMYILNGKANPFEEKGGRICPNPDPHNPQINQGPTVCRPRYSRVDEWPAGTPLCKERTAPQPKVKYGSDDDNHNLP